MKYIVTILPKLKKSAFKELKKIDENIKIEHLDFSLFLVETKEDKFLEKLRATIFIRHVFPINQELDLTGNKEEDLQLLSSALIKFVNVKNKKFMVQCQKIGKELPYNSKDIEVFIGLKLESQGEPVFDDSKILNNPEIKVISLLVLTHKAYLGFSEIIQNLEPYSNPARVYSKWENTISRAEFKLIEAIRKFNIKLNDKMKAIDLGAAPGGWSKVLKDYGLKVIAIDPAELDSRVKGVEHFKGKAEDFDSDEKFDILVNDMNMEPRDSARITLDMTKFLKNKTKVVFTAKLVHRNYDKLISVTKEILSEKFKIISIKNLFHNS